MQLAEAKETTTQNIKNPIQKKRSENLKKQEELNHCYKRFIFLSCKPDIGEERDMMIKKHIEDTSVQMETKYFKYI